MKKLEPSHTAGGDANGAVAQETVLKFSQRGHNAQQRHFNALQENAKHMSTQELMH